MKKHLFLMLITIFTMPLFGQVDTTKVPFVAYWSVGDSYNFKISKTKQQWKEDKLTKDEQKSQVVNFTVIDSTETSYTISWSYENDLGNTYQIPEELLEKFSKYQMTEVKYKTSEVGEFLEILNWEEIRAIMNGMFDDMIELLGKNDKIQQNAIDELMQPLRQVYSSKQGIEQLVLKDIQYFHFLMGLEYNITEPILYEDEFPNMFGGKPIKADGKMYFKDVDFEEGFCTVKQEVVLDPEDTKEVIKQMFKQMKLKDRELKKILKTAVFEIEDNNTYEYYYYPGIPHKIEIMRNTFLDMDKEKIRGIEKTVIELIYNE